MKHQAQHHRLEQPSIKSLAHIAWISGKRLLRPSPRRRLALNGSPPKSADSYSIAPMLETRSVFVHVPKAAGISVSQSLYGCLGGGHITVDKYLEVLGPVRFLTFFKFAFVRNPWERLYSAFRFLSKGGINEKDREFQADVLSNYSEFSDFVLRWLDADTAQSKVHFRPQYGFLFDASRRLSVDFVGFYETLEDDFNFVAQQIGVDTSLPHLNSSGITEDLNEVYSPEMIDKVGALYAADIDTFGYSRINPNRPSSEVSGDRSGYSFLRRFNAGVS
ncbi:MAG: sulfotransferase family 2 domain-containing protein [Pseudomonadota bacterium]